MTYCLNPELVETKAPRDKKYPFIDQFVYLRDAKDLGPERFEVSIGKVVLREALEDADLANEIAELEAAMPEEETETDNKPRVYRTSSCFGYSSDDSVVLVVNSKEPVFVDTDTPPSPFFEDMSATDWIAIAENRAERTLFVRKATAGLSTFNAAVASSPNGLVEYPPTGMALIDEGAAKILVSAPHNISGHWNRFTVLVYRNGGRILFKEADADSLEAIINFPT